MGSKACIRGGCLVAFAVFVVLFLVVCDPPYPFGGTPGKTTFSNDGTIAIHYVTESTAVRASQKLGVATIYRARPAWTSGSPSEPAARYGETYVDYVAELAVVGRVVIGAARPRKRDAGDVAKREYFIVRDGAATFYETIEELRTALKANGASNLPNLVKPWDFMAVKERR